ncbi:hypothetical protein M8J77_018579 [Diaphorina citri]|nr:hypothetical protein M8J77_018579 [Diaphorina citri]
MIVKLCPHIVDAAVEVNLCCRGSVDGVDTALRTPTSHACSEDQVAMNICRHEASERTEADIGVITLPNQYWESLKYNNEVNGLGYLRKFLVTTAPLMDRCAKAMRNGIPDLPQHRNVCRRILGEELSLGSSELSPWRPDDTIFGITNIA